ncbi:MAG TPA: hypothetical protein VFQ19_12190 [Nocardioidaceae bacterium]|nr:hypothetical protein [Nocardioidaceae bacterium]
MEDEDSTWPRELLFSIGALVAAALVIGTVVGLVALGAVRLAGVGSAGAASTEEPSLYIPQSTPSPEPTPPAPTETAETAGSPTDRDRPDKPNRKNRQRITLTATPRNAATFERVYLSGRYRGGNGATLQVQRFDGGWDDFPVTVTVDGNRFRTYVLSGREGVNRFRVVDEATGRRSAPVRVTLR